MSLTAKQLKFAHYVAEGLTASEAYRRVYAASNKDNAQKMAKEAHEVRSNPKVKAYIDQLRAETKAKVQLTRTDILNKLDAIISDPDVAESSRVQAIKVRNEMTGDNAPQQVQVFGLTELMQTVRQRSTNER